MRTLFLDLASGKQLIALVENERTVASEPINGKSESSLVPAIEKIAGNLKTIDRIAAVTGPGGFMSLRVGISLANALSDGLGVPLAGIHLSDVWGARLAPSSPSPFSRREKGEQKSVGEGLGVRVVWLHSTKKELAFICGFGECATKWPDPVLEPIEKLKREFSEETFFVGELIDSQRAALLMLKPLTEVQPLEKVLPTIIEALLYEQKPLLPWYGREA